MFGLWEAGASVHDRLLNVALTCGFIGFVAFLIYLLVTGLKPTEASVPGVGSMKFSRKDGPAPEALSVPPPPPPRIDPDHALVPIKDRPSLLQHRFFKLMQSAANPAFLVPDGRELADKDYVNMAFLIGCKFKAFRDDISQFVSDLETNDGAGISRLPTAIASAVSHYERLAKDIRIRFPDGRCIVGVPTCYLSKFGVWHADHVRFCLESIDRVLADRFYPDWWFRLSSCLEYLNMAFEMTILDADRTLGQLNGDLDAELIALVACADLGHEDDYFPLGRKP